MKPVRINVAQLRVELARRQMSRSVLAHALGVPPTTLGSWVRGDHPAPRDLVARIEAALSLKTGTLTTKP